MLCSVAFYQKHTHMQTDGLGFLNDLEASVLKEI